MEKDSTDKHTVEETVEVNYTVSVKLVQYYQSCSLIKSYLDADRVRLINEQCRR